MKVGTLKKLLAGIPDEVNIGVSDMQDFSTDFGLSTYYAGDTYVDIIIPIYINSYFKEDSDEPVIIQ